MEQREKIFMKQFLKTSIAISVNLLYKYNGDKRIKKTKTKHNWTRQNKYSLLKKVELIDEI